jgi:hypothetical protein
MQLADAQRQLANESQRQGQSGPAGTDAARRRAAEQERLADRMQRLEQSVQQLARAGEGNKETTNEDRKAIGDTARELDKQKLSERMRSAARAQRAGEGEGKQESQEAAGKGEKTESSAAAAGANTKQRAGAREGEEIAKQLDRLAEKLGAATGQSAEARKLSEQLARNRELRERVNEMDRQLAEMRRGGDRQEGQQGQQANPQDTKRGGQPQEQQQSGERSPSSQGQQGQSGQQGAGDGGRGGERQSGEPDRRWQDARQLVDELRKDESLGAWTPESSRFNPGLSAPGTQAWKQDFAKWDELKKQIEIALEKSETSLASQLREQESKDRLNAGATQAVPEQYRRLVDKYYRALAERKR